MRITADDYLRLKKQLQIRPALPQNLLYLSGVAFLLTLGFFLSVQASTITYLLGQFLLGFVFFQCFAFLHECGHGNVSKSSTVNTILGHLVSPFCLLPYYPWKYIHTEHHRWTGNPAMDPTLKALEKRRRFARFRFFEKTLWWLWIPVGGMIQQTVFWFYPLEMLKKEATKPSQIWASAVSVLWMFSVFITLLTVVPTIFNFWTLGPAFLWFFLIYESVNLPHHSDQPVFGSTDKDERLRFWEQHNTTRSCYYPAWLSEFFFMNFNFHIEHHFFPSLPWFRLRRARHLLKRDLGEAYNESHGFDWSLANRKKDPEQVFLKPNVLQRKYDDIAIKIEVE